MTAGVVLATIGIGGYLSGWFGNRSERSGPCALNAEPAFVGDGQRAIALGNHDLDEWTDVVVTLHGIGTAPENQGQAGEAYLLHLAALESLKRRSIHLDEFQKADGARWQPLIMRPTTIEVEARLRGAVCHFQSDLKQTAAK